MSDELKRQAAKKARQDYIEGKTDESPDDGLGAITWLIAAVVLLSVLLLCAVLL